MFYFWDAERWHLLPLPARGRGIAYGFEDPIALVRKMDSESDSRMVEGVGWANSRRFFVGCGTRGPTMRGTIWWRYWSLRWRQCCAARTVARTWPSSGKPRRN